MSTRVPFKGICWAMVAILVAGQAALACPRHTLEELQRMLGNAQNRLATAEIEIAEIERNVDDQLQTIDTLQQLYLVSADSRILQQLRRAYVRLSVLMNSHVEAVDQHEMVVEEIDWIEEQIRQCRKEGETEG